MSVCNVFYGWQQQHYAKSQCKSSDCIYLIAKEAFQLIHFLRQEHKAKPQAQVCLERSISIFLTQIISLFSQLSLALSQLSLSAFCPSEPKKLRIVDITSQNIKAEPTKPYLSQSLNAAINFIQCNDFHTHVVLEVVPVSQITTHTHPTHET